MFSVLVCACALSEINRNMCRNGRNMADKRKLAPRKQTVGAVINRGQQGSASSVNVRNLALDLMLGIMEEGMFCDKALHAVYEK